MVPLRQPSYVYLWATLKTAFHCHYAQGLPNISQSLTFDTWFVVIENREVSILLFKLYLLQVYLSC